MTNYEYFKSMNMDELAEWLAKYIELDDCEQDKFFSEKYCKNCQTSINERGHEEMYCETHENCVFFKEMKSVPSFKDVCYLWLKEEHKEDNQE